MTKKPLEIPRSNTSKTKQIIVIIEKERRRHIEQSDKGETPEETLNKNVKAIITHFKTAHIHSSEK